MNIEELKALSERCIPSTELDESHCVQGGGWEPTPDPFLKVRTVMFNLRPEILALVEAVNYGPDGERNLLSLLKYIEGIGAARKAFNAKLEAL